MGLQFIKLPVAFTPKGMSEEIANDIDIHEEGYLKVNPEYILAYNKNSSNQVTMRFINGDIWWVLLSLEKFEALLHSYKTNNA